MARGSSGLFQAKNGDWVRVASFDPRTIEDLKRYLEVDDVSIDLIREKVASMNRDEVVNFFFKAGVPVAPVYSEPEVSEDLHLKAGAMWVTVDHPKAGAFKIPDFPVKFSRTPCHVS